MLTQSFAAVSLGAYHMTTNAFTSILLENGFLAEPFSSLNNWGMGSEGIRYTKDSCAVLVAKAYCRCHAANTKFVTVTLSEPGTGSKARGRVADAEQSPRTFKNILRGLRLDGFVG